MSKCTPGLTEQRDDLLTACKALLVEVEAMYIDWARFSRGSPDYDSSYKPEFPVCVAIGRAAIAKAEGRQP